MSFKNIIVGTAIVAVAVKIGEAFGYVKGVKAAVDSLDESSGIKELTVKIPRMKNSTYTYRKGE